MITAIIIVALVLGGGTSVAAEYAIPGDILYGVKVNVNEELREAISFSQEAHARVNAWQVQRRLAETEQLAATGELNAENRAEIEARLQENFNEFEDRIDTIAAKANSHATVEVNSDFEAALRAHEQILLRIAAQGSTTNRSNVGVILDMVRGQISDTVRARTSAEASLATNANTETSAAAEGKLTAAENKISEVEGFVAKMNTSLSAEAKVQTNAKLALARQSVISGKAKLDVKAYGEAFVSFQEALRLAQEAQMFASSARVLEIQININGKATTSPPGNQSGASLEVNSNTQLNSGNSSGQGNVQVNFGI